MWAYKLCAYSCQIEMEVETVHIKNISLPELRSGSLRLIYTTADIRKAGLEIGVRNVMNYNIDFRLWMRKRRGSVVIFYY